MNLRQRAGRIGRRRRAFSSKAPARPGRLRLRRRRSVGRMDVPDQPFKPVGFQGIRHGPGLDGITFQAIEPSLFQTLRRRGNAGQHHPRSTPSAAGPFDRGKVELGQGRPRIKVRPGTGAINAAVRNPTRSRSPSAARRRIRGVVPDFEIDAHRSAGRSSQT